MPKLVVEIQSDGPLDTVVKALKDEVFELAIVTYNFTSGKFSSEDGQTISFEVSDLSPEPAPEPTPEPVPVPVPTPEPVPVPVTSVPFDPMPNPI